MITRNADYSIQRLRGLSTDTKPTDVPNGSEFREMDTGKDFMYDEASGDWKEQPKKGGGGGGGGGVTPAQMLYGVETIHEGDDLDDYKTPGTYYCPSGAIAKTLVHTPYTAYNFRLIVEKPGGPRTPDLRQKIITPGKGCQEYVRTGGTFGWNGWNQGANYDSTVRAYKEVTTPGWEVLHAFPGYVVANLSKDYSSTKIAGRFSESKIAYTETQYLLLPFPMVAPTLTSAGDGGGIYISTLNYVNSVVVSFRICCPAAGASDTTLGKAYLRLALQGCIAQPPAAPTIAYNATGAKDALAIAQTYVTARENGRKFAYGENWLYTGKNILNDDNGAGRTECDTYMGLVLRGVDYSHSPYTNSAANAKFTYENLTVNPGNRGWVSRLMNGGFLGNTYLGRDVRFAAEMAWFFWTQTGSVFSDMGNAKAGDLIFFSRDDTKRFFGGITHIGMLDFEDRDNSTGTPYIYEVTTEGNSDGRVVQRVPLTDRAIAHAYFARVNYS